MTDDMIRFTRWLDRQTLEGWEHSALLEDGLGRLEKGWAIDDVISYISYTEHVNPSLSEETALRLMKAIADKYPR